jgi:hypothetical protein
MMTPAPKLWSGAPVDTPPGDIAARVLPFDHVFRFALDGEREKTHRETVTVSVETSFTAVSIGYGVVPEVSPVFFGPKPAPPVVLFSSPSPGGTGVATTLSGALRGITFNDLMVALEAAVASAPDVPRGMPALEAALRNGIKLNPKFARVAMLGNGNGALDAASLRELFQVVSPPVEDVQFLYALSDQGTGREFQSDPILNIAGLGAADGKRPFRYFARPITFAPLATIQMEITELSAFRGALHVSLHGYKMLGGARSPAGQRTRAPRRRSR